MKKSMLCLTLVAAFLMSCEYENKEVLYANLEPEICVDTMAMYTLDVVPILVEHCNRCHRNDRQDGDVNLEGYVNVKPYVDDGSLYGSVNHEAGFELMPTSGVKIPFCEIEKLRLWIEAGALNN